MMYFGVRLKRHAAELLSVGGKSLSFVSRKDNRFFLVVTGHERIAYRFYGRMTCSWFLRRINLVFGFQMRRVCLKSNVWLVYAMYCQSMYCMVSLCSVWLVYVMYGYSGIISTIRKETTRKVTTRKELTTREITITITRTTTTTTAITTSVWQILS